MTGTCAGQPRRPPPASVTVSTDIWISPVADMSSPRLRTSDVPTRVRSGASPPPSVAGLGEAAGVALGDDAVGVVNEPVDRCGGEGRGSSSSNPTAGETFDAPVVAAAMLDQLVHGSSIVPIDGGSYRMRTHRNYTHDLRKAVTAAHSSRPPAPSQLLRAP